MESTKNAMLEAVKTATAKHGIDNLSTRKICSEVGVNDGLIYHYFESLNDMVCQSYKRESTMAFENVMAYVGEVQGIPFDFRDKVRLVFHRTWRFFLDDADRTAFISSFYHSSYYRSVIDFHKEQTDVLVKHLGRLFPNAQVCRRVTYTLMTMIYSSAKMVIDGLDEDTMDTEEEVFSMFYGLFSTQMSPNAAK